MRGLAGLVVLTFGCSSTTTYWRADFHAAGAPPPPRSAPFLEAHTVDGRLYVFEDWQISTDRLLLRGRGLVYDARRDVRARGDLELAIVNVALFQTTGAEIIEVPPGVGAWQASAIVAASILGGLLAVFVIAFALNPPGY